MRNVTEVEQSRLVTKNTADLPAITPTLHSNEQLEQAEKEARHRLKITESTLYSFVDRHVDSGFINRPLGRVLYRFGRTRGLAAKLAPEIAAELDHIAARHSFNEAVKTARQGRRLPSVEFTNGETPQLTRSIYEPEIAQALEAKYEIQSPQDLLELKTNLTVPVKKSDPTQTVTPDRPHWTYRHPEPAPFKSKNKTTSQEELRPIPIEEITQPQPEVAKAREEVPKKKDPLGVFYHPDRAATRRMGDFFQGLLGTMDDLTSQLKDQVINENNPETRSNLENNFDNFGLLSNEFQKLMDIGATQKRTLLNSPIRIVMGGRTTIYAPGSYHHGKNGLASNYEYGLSAFMRFDFPATSIRNYIHVTIFPIPYSRYRQGFRRLEELDDTSPMEAKSILLDRARNLDRWANIDEVISRASESSIMPHIEIGLRRDGHNVSTLRGEVEETENKDEVRFDLVMSAPGFDKVSSSMPLGKRLKGINAKDGKVYYKPPLQKIAEDFTGLVKLKSY